MKLHSDITINGKKYRKGNVISGYKIYPFFLIHMFMFGGSGFLMAYADEPAPVAFLYAHGGFAILIYTIFYITMFGMDEVKWMFTNAGLGLLGIYTQVDWILAVFGKDIGDYPLYVHVIPFLYFVLYTFLLRQFILDVTNSREDEEKQHKAEHRYVVGSILIYSVTYILF